MSATTLTCAEVAEFLMAYIDGELPADRRAEFDRHLRVCPSCVAYLKNYVTTTNLGRGAFDRGADEPAPVPEALLRAILAARPRASPDPAGPPGPAR
jgi:anti-sigma factor RsiW